MGILNSLNQNSGAILTIATIAYAAITAWMLHETKKMRQIQTEPDIFITVQPQERATLILNLIIQNIGLGAAYNLRFEIEPELGERAGYKLSETNFMKRGFRYLAPKQKLECIIANTIEEAKRTDQAAHDITVYYQNKNGKSYQATFALDFEEYLGMRHVATDRFEGIVRELKAIRTDIEAVSKRTGSKLWVVAHTKQEYEEDVRKQLEEFEEMGKGQKENE